MTKSLTSSDSNFEELDSIVIRFAGDSGDGIQLTGDRFSSESAATGNDLATLPDFPAEIRAPAGTIAGVSGFQINFGCKEIFTPGDNPDMLVAMNPAAFKANIEDLKKGGTIILNKDTFTAKNLSRINCEVNPCEDQSLKEEYRVHAIPITRLTKEALAATSLSSKAMERCKNFFTLGVIFWMFNRDLKRTANWINEKFAKKPELAEANLLAIRAGYDFASSTEIFQVSYRLKPAKLSSGTWRRINGTLGLSYGLIAASQKSGLSLFFGAYPITPATELLHELARHKRFGVLTFQAEDEISAIGAAIGASYAGSLGITSSSGPGIALKGEALGLAAIVELPLVVINHQRGGPSTGLPTKTEQSDLFQALYGRHGESPVCVIAASSPNSAFDMAYEACRIAIKYMTPVILLTDGYINNCSEPWKVINPAELKPFEPPSTNLSTGGKFLPYKREQDTLARNWAIPGMPECEHRVGGLEKEDETGSVSYNPENHEKMTNLRKEKIERIACEIPPTVIEGEEEGDLLIIGWGGTEGTLTEAVRTMRREGHAISRIHLHYINPLPSDLGKVLSGFKRVLIPEINSGQLKLILRNKFLIDAIGFSVIRGQPIKVYKVIEEIKECLKQ